MTELVDTTDRDEMIGPMTTDIVDQKQLAEQLLEQAKERTSSWSALVGCSTS